MVSKNTEAKEEEEKSEKNEESGVLDSSKMYFDEEGILRHRTDNFLIVRLN